MLFDYFKEAYRVNRSNRELYGPQLALILVKMVLVTGFGIWVYAVTNGNEFRNIVIYTGDPWAILRLLLGTAGLGLLALIIWLVIVRLVEAGLYNMYKSAVQTGAVQPGAFWAGGAKFFLPFLLGDLVIGIILLVLAPVWLFLGIITLSIGFGVGTIAVGVLLMFWKVSLVWNSKGVIEAVRDSFRFAWSNLAPVTALYIIRRAFTSPFVGGGGGGGGSSGIRNLSQGGNQPDMNWPGANLENVLNFLRIGVAVVTAVAVIAVTVTALIQMLFSVFFGLASFVTYKHGFRPDEEVNPDVV